MDGDLLARTLMPAAFRRRGSWRLRGFPCGPRAPEIRGDQGEAGTIGSTPAVQNAVIDAVAHLGVRHIDMPTSSMRVWSAIKAAADNQRLEQ